MKTQTTIVRYTPASDDGHPPTLVIRVTTSGEVVIQGDEAERVRARVEVARPSCYGYCPECGAPGISRERCIDGNDACAGGHRYPSRDAVGAPA